MSYSLGSILDFEGEDVYVVPDMSDFPEAIWFDETSNTFTVPEGVLTDDELGNYKIKLAV